MGKQLFERRLFVFILAITLVDIGCSDDELHGFDRPCPAGTTKVEGECLPPNGGLRGRFCDVQNGNWRSGLVISLEVDAEERSSTTNGDGWFFFSELPPGHYTLRSQNSDYNLEYDVGVVSNEVTTVGDDHCDSVAGSIEGRVCDSLTGSWVGDARVTLNDSVQTLSDPNGLYRFENLEPGDYTVSIEWGESSASLQCTVEPRQRTELGPSTCDRLTGSIRGRICVGDHYWLSQANVQVEIEEGVFLQTTTDGDGYFHLEGLPQGEYTFEVSRGSYSTSFTASIVASEQTVLQEPICIPPDTTMAVVTGIYDSIEVVLQNLGFTVRRNYNSASSGPTIVNEDGNIDIINGADSQLWFHSFMTDSLWMDEYDIIFFNCGLNDTQIRTSSASLSAMITNLQDYLGKGRSVYASDWASEVIRIAFPNRINFRGNQSTFGAARVGAANANAVATILDSGLMDTIGMSEISVNFNYNIWSVLESMSSQPSDLHIMVKSNIALEGGGQLNNSPVVVRFDNGEGRVVFTSPHHESQLTSDLADLLNYMVFEL